MGNRGWPSTRLGCKDPGLMIHCVAQPHQSIPRPMLLRKPPSSAVCCLGTIRRIPGLCPQHTLLSSHRQRSPHFIDTWLRANRRKLGWKLVRGCGFRTWGLGFALVWFGSLWTYNHAHAQKGQVSQTACFGHEKLKSHCPDFISDQDFA